MPLTYFVAALLLTLAALPSVLRSQPPEQSQTAELSPDAPPSDEQSIIASLNRANSGTTGAGIGEGAADSGAALVSTAPVVRPRACPRGVGSPPRQVESLYSAPCAAAFAGDNGGATWRGVTATEIRFGVTIVDGGQSMRPSYNPGPVPENPPADGDEDENDRTWRVYQKYFNDNFQFWGRKLRIYFSDPAEDEPMSAAVARADEQYGVFGVHAIDGPAIDEAARRGLVTVGGWNLANDYYARNQPYSVAWHMDGSKLMRFAAEYICKKLAGSDAVHAGPGSQGPRRIGLLITDIEENGRTGGPELPALARDRCGVTIDPVVAYSTEGDRAANLAAAVTRFKAAGVTTVALSTDPVIVTAVLNQADAAAYFPEWFITGTWSIDQNFMPTFFGYSRTQWARAFGLSQREMALPHDRTDWYRAYKSVDPAGVPNVVNGSFPFAHLMQIANGIQMAGPNLTPQTFRAGLDAMGIRANLPYWSIGGGYGPGDHSYTDDVAEIWWDNTAPNTDLPGTLGGYRYIDCGRRHRLGALPPGPPRVFANRDDCTTPPED